MSHHQSHKHNHVKSEFATRRKRDTVNDFCRCKPIRNGIRRKTDYASGSYILFEVLLKTLCPGSGRPFQALCGTVIGSFFQLLPSPFPLVFFQVYFPLLSLTKICSDKILVRGLSKGVHFKVKCSYCHNILTPFERDKGMLSFLLFTRQLFKTKLFVLRTQAGCCCFFVQNRRCQL